MASFPSNSWLWSLFDAGVRSLLMAAAVGICLHFLGISNVRARKTAWTMVLTGAMLMPVIAPWAESQSWLPIGAAVVPVRTWLDQAAIWRRALRPETAGPVTPASGVPPEVRSDAMSSITIEQPANATVLGGDHFPSPSIARDRQEEAESPAVSKAREAFLLSEIALFIYLAIAGTLLARITVGCLATMELWMSAEPVVSTLGAEVKVRSSRRVSSPVTIGSGILLPDDYALWDAEKLRIVLAHEGSHVRQGDFYLQLWAALYTAVFWFSPLGWWLKRTLCDLSEAISDGAAVSHAASHASYAQVLLEFAAMPRTTQIGVAMARTGRLSHRIERLLDENSFRQAFAGGRARILFAAVLAPLALFAATSLVRVQAAGQVPPPPAAAPAVPPAPSEAAPAAIPTPPDEAEPAIVAPSTPIAPPRPEIPPSPASPAEGTGSGEGSGAGMGVGDSESRSMSISQSDAEHKHGSHSSSTSRGQHYSYWYSDHGDSYALITGNDKEHVTFSGEWMDNRREDFDKARRIAHGDFLWFTHDGKSYIVDDPATVAGLLAMYKPMDNLGRQQEELGRQQEELGRQQEKMGERMAQATVPTPDVAKEMANLNAAVAALDAAKGKTVTQEQLAELQEKLAEVQGKLGGLQGEMGAHQGEIGEEQGRLGAQQGKLGAQQGRLGEEQGRIAREADRKVKSVIDQSLKDGKARPVE